MTGLQDQTSGIKGRPREPWKPRPWMSRRCNIKGIPVRRYSLVAIGNPAQGEGDAQCADTGDVSETEFGVFFFHALGPYGLCFSHSYIPRRLALGGTFEVHGERTTCSNPAGPIKSGGVAMHGRSQCHCILIPQKQKRPGIEARHQSVRRWVRRRWNDRPGRYSSRDGQMSSRPRARTARPEAHPAQRTASLNNCRRKQGGIVHALAAI